MFGAEIEWKRILLAWETDMGMPAAGEMRVAGARSVVDLFSCERKRFILVSRRYRIKTLEDENWGTCILEDRWTRGDGDERVLLNYFSVPRSGSPALT
jgi:hypothetical protein